MDKFNARKGLALGTGKAQDTEIEVNNGAANKPKVKWNETTQKWQFSNDGVTFSDFGSGGTWGDITGTLSEQTDLQSALDNKENTANKNQANGYVGLDANGKVDITHLPPTAIERVITVSDEISRFALTTNEAQDGDVVRQIDTEIMYFVVDDTNLNNSTGYLEFSVGVAGAVEWSNILNKPTDIFYTGTNTMDDIVDGTTYVKTENNLTDTLKTNYDSAYTHSITTTGNPHNVTKTDVGLENVVNVDTTNPANITWTESYRTVTDTEKTTWNAKVNSSDVVTTATANKILKLDENAKLPASITGNADGNSATATKLQTARKINGVNFDGSADITINAVDTTSRIASSEKGSVNGVATLDNAGKVPSSQLPSYVDDVLEYATYAGFPATGESGKIYVTLNTNLAYRWGGSNYVEISPSIALGETSETAYRGDRGKIAYDHSQLTGGTNPHNTTFANISSKPTTIAGYGITDGVTLTDTQTLTNKTISSPVITGTPTGITSTHVGLGNVVNIDTSNPANITWTASHRTVTDTDKTTWNGKQNALGYTAENSANKKTVWQTTPDNTAYPSEKLVKDSLNLKVDKVTGKQLSTEDYTAAEKTKLSGIATEANNYTHPTGDGNSHIPTTGTTNNGKVLKAGATADSASWGNVDWSEIANKPTSMPASDVYAWAKSSTKPTYTASEIGAANLSHSHDFADLTSKPTTLSEYGITDANSEKWATITVLGDADKYYPVVFDISGIKNRTISVKKEAHNYATWDGALTLEVEVQSGGYGGHAGYTNIKRLLHHHTDPVKYFVAKVSQSTLRNSYLIIWLLGGGRAYIYKKNLETDPSPIVYYSLTTLGGINGTVDVKTAVDSALYQTDIVPADSYNYVKNLDVVTTATADKILKLDTNAKLPANITGNADGNSATATKLQTARTINGVNFDGSADITIPKIHSRGTVTCETGSTRPALSGVSTQSCYLNGYPIAHGEVLTLDGGGSAQLLLGWSYDNATAPAYIRSKRDVSDTLWSDWHMIYTTSYKPSLAELNAASSSHTHAFSELTSKPTTLSGYGITDGVTLSEKGAVNGVATLDSAGKVPASQLPYITQSKSSTYTALITDDCIFCTNTWTLSLPVANTWTKPLTVKNIGTGIITIDANGSQTIDGELTIILTEKMYAVLMSDGTNIHRIGG